MSNIEERIMETVEDYMTTPCHKYAHRLISLYSIYTEKTPPQTFKPKPYYTPILPTLVNAKARIHMYTILHRNKANNHILGHMKTENNQTEETEQQNIGKKLTEFITQKKGE